MAAREWNRFYRARDATEAHLIAQALDGAGIPVQLAGGEAIVAFGDLPADVLLVDVFVPASRTGEAREVVERYFAETAPAGPRRPDWTCPGCGERNPDGFTLCWSCQRSRDPADS